MFHGGGDDERERRRSRVLVLAARMVILLGAAAAAAAAFMPGGRRGPEQGAQPGLLCPMHPEVRSEKPSDCPICGMALERAPPPLPTRAMEETPASESVAAVGVRTSDLTVVRTRTVAEAMDAPAWIEGPGMVMAVLYRDELLALAPGDRAWFHPTATPETRIELRLAAGAPGAWDDSTALAELAIVPGGSGTGRLPPGMPGRVRRPNEARELLVIPETTVVRAPHGPCVFVVSPDGTTFTRRYVELGRSFFDMNAVLSGLSPGDRVAVGPAPFMDAELRLRAAAAHPNGGGR